MTVFGVKDKNFSQACLQWNEALLRMSMALILPVKTIVVAEVLAGDVKEPEIQLSSRLLFS